MIGAGVFDGIVDFKSGFLIGVPNAGDLNTNPTPRQFGVLQEVSVEFNQDLVELHGQFKYPVDVATGKSKIPIKAKYAAIDGRVLGDLWLGVDPSVGMTIFLIGVYAEAHSIPATPGPYTVVVTNTTGVVDYGVTLADGTGLTKVASGVAAGQYEVAPSTGTYTFAAADQGKDILINYSYTSASRGSTVQISNTLMGSGPRFALLLFNQYKTKQLAILFNQCIMGKFSVPRKLAAYAMSDFESQAFADSSGIVGYIYQDTHE